MSQTQTNMNEPPTWWERKTNWDTCIGLELVYLNDRIRVVDDRVRDIQMIDVVTFGEQGL